MSGKLMETIYGNRHKYEIKKNDGGILSSSTFVIYRDGDYWKGSYDSLAKAVDVAKAAP